MRFFGRPTPEDLKHEESVRDQLLKIERDYAEKRRAFDERIEAIKKKLAANHQLKSKIGARLFLHWEDGTETEANLESEKETWNGVDRVFTHYYDPDHRVQTLKRLTYTNANGDVNTRKFVQSKRYIAKNDTLRITMHSDAEWGL